MSIDARVLAAILVLPLLAGCAPGPSGPSAAVSSYPVRVEDVPVPEPTAFPAQLASEASIPWQLTPASTASEAQGEATHLYEVPGYGKVRGTDVAVANLGRPMVRYPGRGTPVRACTDLVRRQARQVGADSVEAALAGPVRRTRADHLRSQVFFRVLYRHGDVTEVRQASLACTVTRYGRLVSATPV